MTPANRALAMTQLIAKWHGCRQEMGADVEEVFESMLVRMDDEIGLEAVRKVCLHKIAFPPEPSELLYEAASIKSPLPNPGDCWNEFYRGWGTSREPKWSHPIIPAVIRSLGGWDYFGSLFTYGRETDDRSIWFARWWKAWDKCAEEWRHSVMDALMKPRVERETLELPTPPDAIPVPWFNQKVEREPVGVRTTAA